MGLVGRTAELDDVEHRLSAGRLVTLVGPGGVGKTALARELGERVAGRYPLGARTVDLTRIDSDEAVPGALAAQLGFDSFRTLLDTPEDRAVLLVVDNCEHLLDGAATTVERILEVCTQSTVLATSRSPLELPGESVVALAPLAVTAGPDPTASPAVELFLARAREAGVDVDGMDVDAVVELCRRLDGLPLAIEIAAARCRTLTPAEIADRLRDGVAVLDRPRFRGTPRHRSITDTIRWSYDLLEPDAQRLLDRLAVFAGPFLADDARAVAGRDMDADRFDAGLDELVHASLVAADTTGPRATYRLLESVRRFGLERLDGDTARAAAFDRFADHVLERARATLQGGTSSWRPGLVRAMVDAYDDLAEALRWCLRHDDTADRAWRLLAAMWPVVHQGRADDVVLVGRRALARWPADDTPLAGSAVATLATAEYVTGQPAVAVELARAGLDRLCRPSIATVLLHRVLGQANRAVGDVPGALDAFGLGGRVARELGMPAMAIELDVAHAQTCADAGEADVALARLAASAEEAARAGSVVSEVWARSCLAWVRLRTQPSAALDEAIATLAASYAADYPIGVAVNLRTLAYAHLLLDDVPAAVATISELLDDLLGRGALSNARLLVDVAAVLAHTAGHPSWEALASTTAALPTATLVGAGFELVPLPPSSAPALDRRQALVTVDRLLADLGPDADGDAASPSSASAAVPPAALVEQGAVWTVTYRGRTVTVRSSKGLADLATLLATPGRDHHCLDLAGALAQDASAGEVIDGAARRAYEDRIRELQADVDDAEAANDLVRAERAQDELDVLVEHLAAALGHGGRTRRATDTAERARSTVTQRIRSAMRQLSDVHPELGRHLTASITTGRYCRYAPPEPVDWHVTRDGS